MGQRLERAIAILTDAVRMELRDHAFGDMEITWWRKEDIGPDGEVLCDEDDVQRTPVAEGFLSGCNGDGDGVTVHLSETDWVELGPEFCTLGALGGVERNDDTGPDEFQLGVCMPGLTIEAVRQEMAQKPEGHIGKMLHEIFFGE